MARLFNIPEDLDDEPWFIEPKDSDPASEFDRQRAFLSQIARLAPAIDVVHIGNEGKSTDWERIRKWQAGVRSGALDLVITWNRGVMFAEFKDGQKMPTRDQRDRLNRYYRQGHHCGVFRKPETLIARLREIGAPFLSEAA